MMMMMMMMMIGKRQMYTEIVPYHSIISPLSRTSSNLKYGMEILGESKDLGEIGVILLKIIST